jgi:YidC/Oxa1 family membrane protein insertase
MPAPLTTTDHLASFSGAKGFVHYYINAGPLEPIVDVMRHTLVAIHSATHFTWAWSIVVLTCVVRIVILPIMIKQTTSMMAMQRLQPYLKQLNERYKDDKQLQQEKVLEFYRDNKVNPLASCLPMVVQFPIFIALLYSLRNFQYTFIHPHPGSLGFLFGMIPNITDATNHSGWGGWALLVFYVGSQLLSTRMMATTVDPRQRAMMYMLPLVFTIFVINFSVGVMIYWIVSNLWTIGQYRIVTAWHKKQPPAPIVMPEDSRGNKKEVIPKAEKAELRRKEKERGQASDGSTSNSSGSTGPGAANTPATGARRNKRRR